MSRIIYIDNPSHPSPNPSYNKCGWNSLELPSHRPVGTRSGKNRFFFLSVSTTAGPNWPAAPKLQRDPATFGLARIAWGNGSEGLSVGYVERSFLFLHWGLCFGIDSWPQVRYLPWALLVRPSECFIIGEERRVWRKNSLSNLK